jgi:hypothetical protein
MGLILAPCCRYVKGDTPVICDADARTKFARTTPKYPVGCCITISELLSFDLRVVWVM